MTAVLAPESIFTPGVMPTHTYVARGDEATLEAALRTGGMLISVAGPTKTGKTVLVQKVVGEGPLIPISGATISAPGDVWRRASEEEGVSSEMPFADVVDGLVAGNRVLLLDDFHYVEREVQTRISQQLKGAIARGLKCIVVSVPHRADDPIRANPDLHGRVRVIDLDYWEEEDLARIAELGFPSLSCKPAAARIAACCRSARASSMTRIRGVSVCSSRATAL